MWKEVAEVVLDGRRFDKVDAIDRKGWESVLLAALSLLPEASACLDLWWHSVFGYKTATSLLHIAARVGSERVAEWVLERGGNLELRNAVGATPLLVACTAERVEMVRMLVERGGDVKTCDKSGRSVLFSASRSGDAKVVAYLLGLGVLDVDEDGESPLCAACTGGYLDVVKVLVEEGGAGVDVEGRSLKGPLYRACQSGNVDIVRLLVDAGSGSEAGKDGGVWVRGLIIAAAKGYVDVLQMLLEMGVGMEGVDTDGNTALCCASRGAHLDVVKILVGVEGVDVNKPGDWGLMPLHLACEEGALDVVEVLLEAGADVAARDGAGRTPLDVARTLGMERIVEVLEEWGRSRGVGVGEGGGECH